MEDGYITRTLSLMKLFFLVWNWLIFLLGGRGRGKFHHIFQYHKIGKKKKKKTLVQFPHHLNFRYKKIEPFGLVTWKFISHSNNYYFQIMNTLASVNKIYSLEYIYSSLCSVSLFAESSINFSLFFSFQINTHFLFTSSSSSSSSTMFVFLYFKI